MLGRADAGKHEQLWRAYGAGTQDDLALSPLLHAIVALLEADDGRALAFKIDPENMRLGFYRQILAGGHGMQKRRGRAVALAVALRDLIEANAILLRAVEIR